MRDPNDSGAGELGGRVGLAGALPPPSLVAGDGRTVLSDQEGHCCPGAAARADLRPGASEHRDPCVGERVLVPGEHDGRRM